jgi:hypothetical protein
MPPKNPAQIIEDAETAVKARAAARQSSSVEYRKAEALEKIADEMTMVRAELHVLRSLFGNYAAMQNIKR